MNEITNRLALGNTTVGFCLGGTLAALFIALSHITGAPGQMELLPLILGLCLSGVLAGFCAGRDNAVSLCIGISLALPGLAVGLLLSPGTLGRMTESTSPLELLSLPAIFSLSFAVAGALGPTLCGEEWRWVRKTSLVMGIGGAAGGGVLAMVLLSLQKEEGLTGGGLTPYIGAVCLAVFTAYVVGGARLDAERRLWVRVPTTFPVSINLAQPESGSLEAQGPVECTARDVSLGGVRLAADKNLATGDVLQLQIWIDPARSIEALGRVVRSDEDSVETTYGVEFLRLGEDQQRRLTRFYVSLERAHHARKRFLVVAVLLIALLLGAVSLGLAQLLGREPSRVAFGSSSRGGLPTEIAPHRLP